jgi:hypothetical protein
MISHRARELTFLQRKSESLRIKLSNFQPRSSVENCRDASRHWEGTLKSLQILKKVKKQQKQAQSRRPGNTFCTDLESCNFNGGLVITYILPCWNFSSVARLKNIAMTLTKTAINWFPTKIAFVWHQELTVGPPLRVALTQDFAGK